MNRFCWILSSNVFLQIGLTVGIDVKSNPGSNSDTDNKSDPDLVLQFG